MKSKVLSAILIILIGVILYSGFEIYREIYEYAEGASSYEALTTLIDMEQIETLRNEERQQLKKQKFEELRTINADVIGWITLEGTILDYPIVQGEDNDYYLYHLLDGTRSKYGSVFMDYHNSPDFTSMITYIYAHHMHNGTMFAELENYENQLFYDQHPVIEIMTESKDYQLELVAGFHTSGNAGIYFSYSTEEEYMNFIDDIKSKSTFDSQVTVDAFDSLVGLSTCSYDFDDARYIVYGKLVEVTYE